MPWIQIRGHHGTGLMTIATSAGTVERAVEDGVVDWPSEVAMPAGSTAAEPPTAVRAREQARRRAEVAALAASVGLTVHDPAAEAEPTARAASKKRPAKTS